MLDPATARLCVWRLPLEAAFRLFSKLGSLGGSIRERFSRTGRTRPALARPAFSRWLLENDRLRERWPCQWLNVLYFPFSETSPRRGAAPQESNGRPGSGIVRNGEAGQGWHRPPAPPERAQDARSRPRPGVGPSDPRKTPLRPRMRPESADQVRVGRPGRGGRVVFCPYACKM